MQVAEYHQLSPSFSCARLPRPSAPAQTRPLLATRTVSPIEPSPSMVRCLPHLRSLLCRCLLSNGRSHLQGYTEEKVQKFRQLVRLSAISQKDSKKLRWQIQGGNSISVICDVKIVKMTIISILRMLKSRRRTRRMHARAHKRMPTMYHRVM